MSNLSAQGSITVKRLRNGDTFFISLDLNGVPLYQGVDPVTGDVPPDWRVAANQPVITPKVTSARGNIVSLGGHQWSYNGQVLVFTGASSGNWTPRHLSASPTRTRTCRCCTGSTWVSP